MGQFYLRKMYINNATQFCDAIDDKCIADIGDEKAQLDVPRNGG